MNATDLQSHLFKLIKSNLPNHISLADKISDLLNVSADSAYRRIRGEKPLTLDELKLICESFDISLDQVLNLKTDTLVFTAPEINSDFIPIEDYLKGILRQVKYFNSFSQRRMSYLCKDAPVFYFYLFPEIAAFKTFFWTKSIQSRPEYQNKSFSIEKYPFSECFHLGQQINEEYTNLPCCELWNPETLNSTISQIKYYADAGMFHSGEDFGKVLLLFDRLIDHLQVQAEEGVKFMPGAGEAGYRASIELYVNEVIIGNNTILLDLNDSKSVFITYQVLSYMMSKDERLVKKLFAQFNTLKSRSTLISKVGEKERNRFFRKLKEKLNLLRAVGTISA